MKEIRERTGRREKGIQEEECSQGKKKRKSRRGKGVDEIEIERSE
jgi:hypothetical protein